MSFPRLHQSDTPLEDAVTLVVDALRDVDSPRIALSGGSAGSLVGPLRRALGGRWSRVRLTWADERAVPFADEASNRGALYRSGALSAAYPVRRELSLFTDGETLEEAAARASEAFERDFGGLDVAILGMGGDAHIASHFPQGEAQGEGAVQIVRESPKPPAERLTLSLRTLSLSRLSLLYACGEGKRSAIEATLLGTKEVPARALERLVLVTDLADLE